MTRWGAIRRASAPSFGSKRTPGFSLVAVLGTLVACTPFQDGDDIRQQQVLQALPNSNVSAAETADGLSEEPVALDPWDCLEQLTTPGQDLPGGDGQGDLVTLRVPFHNFVTQQPIVEAQVKLCVNSDINCTEPLQDFQPVLPTGEFVALVPWGFSGYLQVEGPGLVPVLVMVDTVVYRDLNLYSHGLIPVDVYGQFAQALQVDLNSEAALFLSIVRDCYGREAEGATVQLDAGDRAVAYGVAQGVPSIGVVATGREGNFGYANAAPGLARMTAASPEGVSFDEQGAVLRSGMMTQMTARPRVYSVEELCSVTGTPLVPGTRAALGQLLPCDRL